MKQKVIFAAAENREGANPQITSERLINCYAEPQPDAAKSPLLIRPVSLLDEQAAATRETNEIIAAGIAYPLATTAAAYFLGMYSSTTARLYRFNSNNTVTSLATTTIGTDARATMAATQGYIMVVASSYNVFDIGAGTWSSPGSGAISVLGSVTYLNGYTILGEDGGRRFEWTDLGDPTTRDALNVATKEGRGDQVRRVIASQGRLYVLGAQSTEIWYLTGQAGPAAFERVPNAVYDIGCLEKNLAIDAFESLYVVADDYTVIEWRGGGYRKVSNLSVEAFLRSHINGGANTIDQILAWEDRGRKIIAVVGGGNTWAYCLDVETGLWHIRGGNAGSFDEFWPTAAVAAYGRWIFAGIDFDASPIERVFWDIDPGSNARVSQFDMYSRPLDLDGEAFRLASVEFRIREAATGSATFYTSNDGYTYSSGRTYTLANAATQRTRPFRGLGRFRQLHTRLQVNTTSAGDVQVDAAAIVDVA